MLFSRRPRSLVVLAVVACLPSIAVAQAQEPAEAEEERPWSNEAELSLVATDGNAESTTVGFKNAFLWERESDRFKVDAAALRAETTSFDRRAVGTPEDFRVITDSQSELSAESYSLNGRYDREINERLFWFTGAGWERDEPAGIENRFSVVAGAGHRWFDTDTATFRTDYGLTYTDEETVVEKPGGGDSFLGLRLSYEYSRQLTATTKYGSDLVVNENLDDTDDLRADFTNALSVTMSERLALKVSLQLLYDKQPALVSVGLQDAAGNPTGESVAIELEELDSRLKVALVVSF